MESKIKSKDVRKDISEYMMKRGIKRSWLATKIDRSPTLVTMILDCTIPLTESNLLKINKALFPDDPDKYFTND